MSSRYDRGDAADFEPGSDGKVLRNKLGLTDPSDIDEVELSLLQKLYEAVLVESFPDRRLRVADLKNWHRRWLGNVYAWAGEERSVNVGKGDFHFAAAAQIPRLLDIFERDCLAKFTPCQTWTMPAPSRRLPVPTSSSSSSIRSARATAACRACWRTLWRCRLDMSPSITQRGTRTRRVTSAQSMPG